MRFSIINREPIRTIASSGVVMVDGRRIRDLAIHPSLNETASDGSPIWTVTHVPTGFRLGGQIGFETETAALDFIKALDALPFDWSDGTKLRKNGNMRAAFASIAALCGAVELVRDAE